MTKTICQHLWHEQLFLPLLPTLSVYALIQGINYVLFAFLFTFHYIKFQKIITNADHREVLALSKQQYINQQCSVYNYIKVRQAAKFHIFDRVKFFA